MKMNNVTPNFTPRAQKAIASSKKIAMEELEIFRDEMEKIV